MDVFKDLLIDLDFIKNFDFSTTNNEPFFKPFNLSRVQFGTMLSEKEFSAEWDSQEKKTQSKFEDLSVGKLSFDFKRSNIMLFFFVGERFYKLQTAFSQLNNKIVVEEQTYTTITLSSLRNPLLWVAKAGVVRNRLRNPFIIRDWIRTTEISASDGIVEQQPCSLLMRQAGLPLENWPVWRMELTSRNIKDTNGQFNKAMETLVSYKMCTITKSYFIQTVLNTSMYNFSYGIPSDITFTRLYLIECLVSNSIINRFQLTPEFFKLIQKPPRHILERVVERLFSKKQLITDPVSTFEKEIEMSNLTTKQKVDPATHALVRKVLITPTRFYILPPVLEESNRILRQYPDFQDRFLRVTFCDESFNPIHANIEMNFKLLKHIQDVLFFGVHIARRQYQFLAFSSSQLKDHSCWFFSDGKGCTADLIRSQMGNFKDIRIVAKHAARMGQCFSSSRDGAKIGRSNIKLIRDVKYGNNLFTDGVGKISLEKMKEIARQLELNTVPSAIQFRMGGFKGVLSSWPDLPPLPILVRGSQEKFSSEHDILEVIRIASHNAAHLNRQIILLLSTLGVPDSVFHELQNEMLSNIRHMMTDPTVAIPTLSQLSDEFGSSRELIKLLDAGFFSSSDHFVKNCLSVFYAFANNMLKNRARIQVPNGALLMGVADETGTLAPDEIFIQYKDPCKVNKIIRPTGKCIVTRNPCFHPGDIRVVTAVDVPGLHHLTDCVVFSIQGTQSIPSMCSGGDLDGDDFTVIWDQRLIPPISNLEPMKHLPAIPIEVDNVSINDIKTFFGNYIMNDNLGQIANAHLAISDDSPEGAQDSRCLQLAQLHSRAVDFTKTGIKAELDKNLRANKFPDFMDKDPKKSYTSSKILGQLYRSLDYVRNKPPEASKPDASLLVPGHTDYLEEAYIIKNEYDETLNSLMDQYGIENELEIVTGCILKYREMVCKRAYEARRIICQAYHVIKLEFLRKFNEEFKDSPLDKPVLAERMRCKASAWYYAAYNPSTVESGPLLESFAWIAKDHLIPIKLKHTYGSLTNIQPNHLGFDLATNILRREASALTPSLPTPVSIDDLDDLFANL